MSATNWAACPRCVDKMRAEKEVALQMATEAYGSVSIEVFDQMRAEAEAMPTDQSESRDMDDGGYSLREDYNHSCLIEEDGTFVVHYHAACPRCGFDYKFNVDEDTGAIKKEN